MLLPEDLQDIFGIVDVKKTSCTITITLEEHDRIKGSHPPKVGACGEPYGKAVLCHEYVSVKEVQRLTDDECERT